MSKKKNSALKSFTPGMRYAKARQIFALGEFESSPMLRLVQEANLIPSLAEDKTHPEYYDEKLTAFRHRCYILTDALLKMDHQFFYQLAMAIEESRQVEESGAPHRMHLDVLNFAYALGLYPLKPPEDEPPKEDEPKPELTFNEFKKGLEDWIQKRNQFREDLLAESKGRTPKRVKSQELDVRYLRSICDLLDLPLIKDKVGRRTKPLTG